MPYNLYNAKGEPSFNGIDPKIKTFGGYAFGWHKLDEPCVFCGNWTHYSLHRRYKFTSQLERYKHMDRLWICSENCFKQIIFKGLFDLVVPPEIGNEILIGRK